MASFASARSGSEMQMTAASSPAMHRYRWEYWRVERVEFLLLGGGDGTALVFKDEMRAADEDLFALDHAGELLRDDILHLRVVFLMLEILPLGLVDDGIGHRVRIMLLQARGQPQHFRGLVGRRR